LGRFNKFHLNCCTYYLIVLHIFILVILLSRISHCAFCMTSIWSLHIKSISQFCGRIANVCTASRIPSHLCSHIYRVLFTRMFIRSRNYLYLCSRLFLTDHMCVFTFPRIMIHRTRPGVPARDGSWDHTFSHIDLRNGAKQYFAFYSIAKSFLFHKMYSHVPFNIILQMHSAF